MFQPSWVLRGQLALGPAPSFIHHLHNLEQGGVVSILSLCSEREAPPPFGLFHRFFFKRSILPDHKYRRTPSASEFQCAFDSLLQLIPDGPVYVHCQAGVERSPLLCMAYLMHFRGLSMIDSLDYVKRVHPSAGPLPEQLASLQSWRLMLLDSSGPFHLE